MMREKSQKNEVECGGKKENCENCVNRLTLWIKFNMSHLTRARHKTTNNKKCVFWSLGYNRYMICKQNPSTDFTHPTQYCRPIYSPRQKRTDRCHKILGGK